MLFGLGPVPTGQAMEILRWGAAALAVPLVVGQERVVFIDRNVRIGVPAGVGENLRVQRRAARIYLRASEIPSTRLQLQDVESGALILLDIAAEPAKDGLRWNRCASSKAKPPRTRLRRRCSRAAMDDTQGDAPAGIRSPARNAGTGRADAPCGTEPVCRCAPSNRSPASAA